MPVQIEYLRIDDDAGLARENAVQAWPHIVGAGLQLMAGGAILKFRLAARGVAIGACCAGRQQRHEQRRGYTNGIDHACTSGPGFFT